MGKINKDFLDQQKNERIGAENYNSKKELMKVVDYIDSHNVIIEFQDEWKRKKSVYWKNFIEGKVRNPHDYERLGEEKINYQGCLMKIIKYNNNHDIIVKFKDKYRACVHSCWERFKNGRIKNPYFPEVYGVGMIGVKYSSSVNGNMSKEYITWVTMIRRCYDLEYKRCCPTYKECSVCEEWLLYENFYEWLHSQENFEKWYNGEKWAIDKDILIKGNKIYSPNTCCLVPHNINSLFAKRNAKRGNLPIGVVYYKPLNKYKAQYDNNVGKNIHIKYCKTPEEAFQAYKIYKENLIKQIAQDEYDKGNIIKKCYDAMMSYQVEITD